MRKYTKNKDDCWRCCIANLIKEDPKNVPDFVNNDTKKWYSNTEKRLKKKGYNIKTIEKFDGIEFFMPIGVHIRIGKSIGGHNHACIYETNNCVYDPSEKSLTGSGLQEGTVYKYVYVYDKDFNFCHGFGF